MLAGQDSAVPPATYQSPVDAVHVPYMDGKIFRNVRLDVMDGSWVFGNVVPRVAVAGFW